MEFHPRVCIDAATIALRAEKIKFCAGENFMEKRAAALQNLVCSVFLPRGWRRMDGMKIGMQNAVSCQLFRQTASA